MAATNVELFGEDPDGKCPMIPALLREINVAVRKTSSLLSTCPDEASVQDLATASSCTMATQNLILLH